MKLRTIQDATPIKDICAVSPASALHWSKDIRADGHKAAATNEPSAGYETIYYNDYAAAIHCLLFWLAAISYSESLSSAITTTDQAKCRQSKAAPQGDSAPFSCR